MAELSQSAFLKALGWATLNSFWQMALLWCMFLLATYVLKLSADKKYRLAIASIITGFIWFISTFIYYYQTGTDTAFSLLTHSINSSSTLLNSFLIAASVTYLSLLVLPAYRLFNNWQYVRFIRKNGLKKIEVHYKLFTTKIAGHLAIKRKVQVHLSELIKSPVTVGFLKPMILLPVACMNNLSVTQVEAILLHELSHIKRGDYLMNILVSVAHTFLYFNPFVKLFIKVVEAERENCCDQMVLQFDYDKISYANALLTLEKSSSQMHVLAIAAAGKKYLLNRIEKIVGMEKKPVFSFNNCAGVIAAIFCIFLINSVVITSKQNFAKGTLAFTDFANPFYFLNNPESLEKISDKVLPVISEGEKGLMVKVDVKQPTSTIITEFVEAAPAPLETPEAIPAFIQASNDDIETSLTDEQKEKVKTAVDATKKVLGLQWTEVEKSIADAMTHKEKEIARQQYLNEVDNINWKKVEDNLKAGYENIDWEKLNSYISVATTKAQLDSLQENYYRILSQIEKAEAAAKLNCQATPFPDESVEQIQKRKSELRKQIQVLNNMRKKKVVTL